MKARCANCRHVFSTEATDSFACPSCGAVLTPKTAAPIGEPGADDDGFQAAGQQPPEQAEGQTAESHVEDSKASESQVSESQVAETHIVETTPWERRRELGFFKALADTAVLSIKSPKQFFERMPTDDAKGAFSYYCTMAGLGSVFTILWGRLLAPASHLLEHGLGDSHGVVGAIRDLALQYLLGYPKESSLAAALIFGLAFIPIRLLGIAGLTHLALYVFKAGERGFSATLRATAYSSAPLALLGALPFGNTAGRIAHLVFMFLGLSAIHGRTKSKAFLAAFSSTFLVSFLLVIVPLILFAAGLSLAICALGFFFSHGGVP